MGRSLRWVEPQPSPQSANLYYARVVHFQRVDRCPSYSRLADHHPTIFAPTEMSRPVLQTGMKELNLLAGEWINRG